ncbi:MULTISPECIES: hypothetical protein [Bradyrhizobium]|uniref:Uncharacterized protein n=3 Tax=Bradyrhizobium TaxID=374 RepID=A0AAE5X924_9BRAD|nr:MULTISPECIES: hypothetical protein [Bradyrhizobium]MCG2628273.1 hypothetical protein [Bradyrhizobium zhengyangense]MCG2643392.1 hypothetical protein [Bradyrhizobium zhengyangense]MCG2670294.1 hypothetical protein [Bradyrhizobium zhengyangense]MDN4985972.1 hypothetical protein [Bradyrhizobium sp. WYCCWR 13022]MDN5002648.1 hypothetical protein [Bradyrhizobium sp. WYCCWR 12677]
MSNEDLGASTTEQAQGESESLVLYGNTLLDRLTFVSTTFSSLIMSMGRVGRDNREVLVPLVEVRFEGPSGQDESALKSFFSELVPLENLAFVLEDISGDLATVCHQLSAVSEGPVKPDLRRLAETSRFLQDAKSNLDKCLADLERIGQPPNLP